MFWVPPSVQKKISVIHEKHLTAERKKKLFAGFFPHIFLPHPRKDRTIVLSLSYKAGGLILNCQYEKWNSVGQEVAVQVPDIACYISSGEKTISNWIIHRIFFLG